MVQLQIISRVITTKDISIILDNNLTPYYRVKSKKLSC